MPQDENSGQGVDRQTPYLVTGKLGGRQKLVVAIERDDTFGC